MTVCLPPPSAASYRLVDELREPMGISSVHRVALDDVAVEQSLLAKLGARGWGRIHHFRNHYNQSWGEHRAAPVSPRALDSLARFVGASAFPAGKTPSVFLTEAGGIELCWEDAASTARQIEFKSDSIDYYLAARNEEGTVGLDAISELAAKMSAA